MTTEPEDVIEPVAPPEHADDGDEALDDAAQGVSATSDDLADGTQDTGEIDAMGRAAGLVERADRPIQGIDEVDRRDVHRWELDPASAEADLVAEADLAAN